MKELYHIILNDENVKTQKKHLGITEERMQLAGLKDSSLLDLLYEHLKNPSQVGLYTIAARPAMGKSLVTETIVEELIDKYHKNVKYIQCEEIIDKVISRKQNESYDFLYEIEITIDRVEEEIKDPDIDVVIIDSYNFMYRKGVDCAEELKKLARKYKKQIFALSSVSRKADGRKDKRPTKEDMTKQMCDSLWESSDSVIFLYRDRYYNEDSENNNMEIIIAKNEFYVGKYKYDSVSTFNFDYDNLKRRGE